MPILQKLLLVAAGGAIGSAFRYSLSGIVYRMVGSAFPWGTLAVNVLGCFFIGHLWGLAERFPMRPGTSLLIFTGILGAFTTFSTYGLESVNLLREGETARAIANVVASNLIGLVAVLLGFALARYMPGMLGVGGES